MDSLIKKANAIIKKTIDDNHWRQHCCFNLIPSETTPSLLVKLCEISDPAGRYAEHRMMKGREIYFYQGIDFIRDVEAEIQSEMCKFFECSKAELRPISGQMANEVVFKAVTKFVNRDNKSKFRRLKAVINNDLGKGGHLSSQPMGALFNYVEFNEKTGKENVVNFPVDKENPYKIDVTKLKDLIWNVKPELIIFGKSMFIHPEPVREVAEIIKEMDPKPIILYDMAHVLGLYGLFQDPLKEGADIVTGSTHKTFFGPQRGVIVSNIVDESQLVKLWSNIRDRAFPGSTSNHHLGTLLGLLFAVYEMNAFKKRYQEQVCKNAKAFAKALLDNRIDVEGDASEGYTNTHQVLFRVSKYGTGEGIAKRLEENNIIVNYQALPDDESFLNSSGIRSGVQEMTRFGMKEKDFSKLASYMADVIIRNKNVKKEIINFRQKFLEMKFCLPKKDACSLGAKVLSSMMPNSDYLKCFAKNLESMGR